MKHLELSCGFWGASVGVAAEYIEFTSSHVHIYVYIRLKICACTQCTYGIHEFPINKKLGAFRVKISKVPGESRNILA